MEGADCSLRLHSLMRSVHIVLGLANKFCNYRNIHWLSVIPCLCYLLRIFKCIGVILDRFSHNEFSLIRMNCSTFFIINRTL